MMQEPRPLNQWDQYAERIRVQLPAAPDSILDGYVQWMPWLAIVFGGLGVLLTVGGLLLGAVLSPFLLLAGAQGIEAGASAFVALVLLFLGGALDLVGGCLMLRRSMTGWWLFAMGIVVGLASSLFGVHVLSLLIALVIGYLHLLVKPRFSQS